MKTLIWREFNIIIPSWQKFMKVSISTSIFILIATWLLGPRMFHLLEVESLSFFIAIMFFLNIQGLISQNLKQDSENAQQYFLQTLPVKKTNIIHAKFLSVFMLFCVGIVGSSVLMLIHLWMNKGTFEDIGIALTVTSLFIFSLSIMVFRFIVSDTKHIEITFYGSLPIWIILFIVINLWLDSMSIAFKMTEVAIFSLLFSLILFFVLWFFAARIIHKRGFKQMQS